MIKRDYELIAGVVRAHQRAAESPVEAGAVLALARTLADMFAGENPRFDRERFLAACAA